MDFATLVIVGGICDPAWEFPPGGIIRSSGADLADLVDRPRLPRATTIADRLPEADLAVVAASGATVEDFPADPAAVAAVVSAAEGPLAAASAAVGAAPVPLEEAEAAAAVLSVEAAALADPVADSPVVPAVAASAAVAEDSPVVPAAADADKTKRNHGSKEP